MSHYYGQIILRNMRTARRFEAHDMPREFADRVDSVLSVAGAIVFFGAIAGALFVYFGG